MTHVRNDLNNIMTCYDLKIIPVVTDGCCPHSFVYIRYNVNTSLVLSDIPLFIVPHVSALIISRCQALVRMSNKTSLQHIAIILREISTL